MQRVLSQNGILTDGILQVQAKKFAELLVIPEDDLKQVIGESESVPVEDLPEHRKKLVELLLQYKLNDEYTHVKIYILLPLTTLYLQPYNARIINLFKSYYQKLFLQNIVDAINAEQEIPHINILEAISAITANNYIRINDSLEIEDVILDKVAMLEEILSHSNSNSSSDESVIEIEKISHS
ncbi:9916_t:CDS:2, partial [Gigaspora rosea]